MAISEKYIEYVKKFGQTLPLRDYAARNDERLLTLRHDVDHDLDVALEIAFWEHEHDCRSTFFILHTAPYMQDPRLTDKLLQIQDFGHEVAIHSNFLTQWITGEIEDPGAEFRNVLDHLRGAGLEISGMSAHGDRACYRHGFINYWMFRELCPEDPIATESRKNAEGIPCESGRHRIPYPKSHVLVAPDGRHLTLWQTPMQELGLDYDAIHVPTDRYFTDSGGGWIRSGDPMQEDLSSGRIQVLIHPIYWQGPRTLYFFLSTARSGSKWMSTVLDQATSVRANHEFLLNHRYEDGELREEHRTGPGFKDLSEDAETARDLILNMQPWLDELDRDYAEVNVYLPFFLEQLQEIFPHASHVFLQRDPAKVFRSIINRGWYDTRYDTAHGTIPVEEWGDLGQYERCACYIGWTMSRLENTCAHSLRLEEVVGNPEVLGRRLKELGIAFYPRLASEVAGQVINANKENEFPDISRWPPQAANAFRKYCRALPRTDPYRTTLAHLWQLHRLWIALRSGGKRAWVLSTSWLSSISAGSEKRPRIFVDPEGEHPPEPMGSVGGTVTLSEGFIHFEPSHSRHAYMLFGSRQWGGLRGEGWPIFPGEIVSGSLSIEGDFPAGTFVRIMMLGYSKGKLTEQRTLATVSQSHERIEFGGRPKYRSVHVAIALHMPADCQPEYIRIGKLYIAAGNE